jgi:hypothetical protein
MATSAQIDANCRNAQSSTGPRTDAGKAMASQNAYKHGLRSASPVARGEDPAAWLAFAAEVIAEYDPVGIAQRLLAERIAFLQWKLVRIPGIEALQMACTRMRLRDRSQRGGAECPLYPSAEALIASDLDSMLKLQTYEMRLQRALATAQRELRDLQRAAAEQAAAEKELEDKEQATQPAAPPPSPQPIPAPAAAVVVANVPASQRLGEDWLRSSAAPPVAPPPATPVDGGGAAG